MTYEEILQSIEDDIDAGCSLTMQDLTEEAQAVLRARHPDGDLPLPDLADL